MTLARRPPADLVAEHDRDTRARLVLLSLLEDAKAAEKSLQRVNRALKTLSAGTSAVVHADSEAALLRSMCDVLIQAGYHMAWIGSAEHDAARSVKPMAWAGEGADYVERAQVTWAEDARGRGPIGRCIRSGQFQVSHEIEADPSMAPWRDAARAHGYRSVVAFPLAGSAGPMGALAIYAGEREAFDDDELELLSAMAGELAFGLMAIRSRTAHDEGLRRLERSMEATVGTLASVVELRDPYTAGHQRRVSAIAIAIAGELGLPPEQIRGLALAASIHDVGKMSVPAEILAKPGSLSEVEHKLVEGHAEAGYQIMKDLELPWPVAEIIRQHHERVDGSGYPRGLKGDEILLEARILAVADVIEAIASHRPYRASQGLEAGLEEIRSGRGTRYDAAVVDACLKQFGEHGFKVPD